MIFKCIVLTMLAPLSFSIPIRENAQWTMLLCKFRNNSYIPHPKEWFVQWLTDESYSGTIAHYFRIVSNGIYTVSNSKVFGWYEIPYTKHELTNLAGNDERLKDKPDSLRMLHLKTKEICLDHARTVLRIDLPSPHRVITVVNDEDIAIFCKENGVLVAPRFMMTTAVTHEMVHSFFLGHSYSDVPIKVFPYSSIGEYDDRYDLMSTANAYMIPALQFSSTGPGLNGPHLDYLGWLPSNRFYYFGRDGNRLENIKNLRLSSLSRPHHTTKGWLLVMIPYDRDDPQKVYTLELRTKEYLDSGIPKSAIVVHQISRRDGTDGYLYSTVLNQGGSGPDYELDVGSEWVVFIDKNRYIKLHVFKIDSQSASAEISIFSSFSPTTCNKSEIERSAFVGDSECVTILEGDIIRNQNLQRNKTESTRGICLPGFVPRLAGPYDDVCVTGDERELARVQNERGKKYRSFYDQVTFGLNRCKEGFVWRQIDPYDYICVEPYRRQEIKKQNGDDDERRISFLSDCYKNFVPRRAVPGDDVCVTKEEQAVVTLENSRKLEKYAYPKFFNGEDKVE